jgi:hypothetical protein
MALLYLLKAWKSISWVDCEIDREVLLQMRNLYSVSVLYSISHTALIKLFVENHLYKRKFMEVFLLLPRNGKN